ncbi:MAG: class I SAM-dependent methyltransferase, partial [Geodermatophilales bacterium]|nr:class I SAM-dependent methyltransferase [Geodermatophilales bacterium]
MTEKSAWVQLTEDNPQHSAAYIQRWRDLAAQGRDLVGEARLVDAMVPRGARLLDAGCGTGRLGGYLAAAGHTIVGVDVDPVLIAAAEQDRPGSRWLVGDLAELDLPGRGIPEPFDGILCAGNVMTFLAPSTRVPVLRRLRAHVRPDGRAAIGFGAGRGYPFEEFLDDARSAGWTPD